MVGIRMTHLTKLHGTGNDFLVTPDPLGAADAVALCDRFTGVGADGLLVLGPGADGADATMTLYNADGSRAEMSGNGARCLAWVARRAGMGTPDRLVVDTGGGRRTLTLRCDAAGEVTYANCDMGAVTFDPGSIPVTTPEPFDLATEVDGVAFTGDAAGLGNPHWVVFVPDPGAVDVARVGPVMEYDPRFPSRVNVEFVRVVDRGHIELRVWERGVGETRSCGTGACAAAAVARRRGEVDGELTVGVPGGRLEVWVDGTVRLGGPVTHVFDVDVDLDRLHS